MAISFDRAADYYDATRSFRPDVMRKIMSVLTEELKGLEPVLDTGVGTGRFARPLIDAGFEVVGVDISRRMLEKARQKSISDLVLGDARYLPFEDKAFGSTTSIHLLHLIAKWEDALREIARVTRTSLVTVTEHGKDYDKAPNSIYKKIAAKYGYAYNHPGEGEWNLSEMIIPVKSITAATYKGDSRRNISQLGKKLYSYQWKIPDNIHKKTMTELKQHFTEKQVFKSNVIIHVWNIRDIEKYIASKKGPASTPPPSRTGRRRRRR